MMGTTKSGRKRSASTKLHRIKEKPRKRQKRSNGLVTVSCDDSSGDDSDSDASSIHSADELDTAPLALAIGHMIVDSPAHPLYHLHVTEMLTACASDSQRLSHLCERIREKAEEMSMRKGGEQAVRAIRSAFCARAAEGVREMLGGEGEGVREEVLARVLVGIVDEVLGTGWGLEEMSDWVEGVLNTVWNEVRRMGRERDAERGVGSVNDAGSEEVVVRDNEVAVRAEASVSPHPETALEIARGGAPAVALHQSAGTDPSASPEPASTLDIAPNFASAVDLHQVVGGVELIWDRIAKVDAAVHGTSLLTSIAKYFTTPRDHFIANYVAHAEYHYAVERGFPIDLRKLSHEACKEWDRQNEKRKRAHGNRVNKLLGGDLGCLVSEGDAERRRAKVKYSRERQMLNLPAIEPRPSRGDAEAAQQRTMQLGGEQDPPPGSPARDAGDMPAHTFGVPSALGKLVAGWEQKQRDSLVRGFGDVPAPAFGAVSALGESSMGSEQERCDAIVRSMAPMSAHSFGSSSALVKNSMEKEQERRDSLVHGASDTPVHAFGGASALSRSSAEAEQERCDAIVRSIASMPAETLGASSALVKYPVEIEQERREPIVHSVNDTPAHTLAAPSAPPTQPTQFLYPTPPQFGVTVKVSTEKTQQEMNKDCKAAFWKRYCYLGVELLDPDDKFTWLIRLLSAGDAEHAAKHQRVKKQVGKMEVYAFPPPRVRVLPTERLTGGDGQGLAAYSLTWPPPTAPKAMRIEAPVQSDRIPPPPAPEQPAHSGDHKFGQGAIREPREIHGMSSDDVTTITPWRSQRVEQRKAHDLRAQAPEFQPQELQQEPSAQPRDSMMDFQRLESHVPALHDTLATQPAPSYIARSSSVLPPTHPLSTQVFVARRGAARSIDIIAVVQRLTPITFFLQESLDMLYVVITFDSLYTAGEGFDVLVPGGWWGTVRFEPAKMVRCANWPDCKMEHPNLLGCKPLNLVKFGVEGRLK